MNGIKLLATGRHLPSRCVTNDDLSRMVETNDQWIRERTGIATRYLCGEGETNTGNALAAARQAMERSGLAPEDIGLCVAATFTADHGTPSLACELHHLLGLPETTPSFDVNAACTGFLHALEVARCMLASGTLKTKRALVVGSEVLSRLTDFTDRSTCILFGDGAGAAIIELDENAPFASVLGARGDAEVLRCGGAGIAGDYIYMDGKAVFRFAVEAIPRCVEEVLRQANLTMDQVDHVICHQANARIIDHAMRKLKAPAEKFYKNIDKYGNTSSASIPIALDEMLEKGVARPGDTAILVGFGGGLTWGGLLLQL